MRRTLCACFVAVALAGQVPPSPQAEKVKEAEDAGQPKAIPADKYEEISRAMLRLQSAQIAFNHAQKELETAGQAYDAMMTELRQHSGAAPECAVTIDKKWFCPPAPTAKGK